MADVLVRGLDAATVARFDAAARRAGISRNAWLQARLAELAEELPADELSDRDVADFGHAVSDLLDPDFRATMWQR